MYARVCIYLRACLLTAVTFSCGHALGGSPPLITDDPETPGLGGWEINITSSFEHARDGTAMENPLFDINYGLTSDHDQLTVEFALLSNDPENAESEWGISDLSVAYKYRFLEEDEGIGWMVSIYPHVSSPTGNDRLGLGSGQTEMLIPFELDKHFCDDKAWINPEIGYNIVFGKRPANSWDFGLAVGYEFPNSFELEGEVGAFVFPGNSASDNPFFNLGFEYPLNKNAVLVGSAGRSFRSSRDGTPDLFCLLGVQFLLGAAAKDNEQDEGDKDSEAEKKKPGNEAGSATFLRDQTASTVRRELQRTLDNPAAY
jgi:hypothetical protein